MDALELNMLMDFFGDRDFDKVESVFDQTDSQFVASSLPLLAHSQQRSSAGGGRRQKKAAN